MLAFATTLMSTLASQRGGGDDHQRDVYIRREIDHYAQLNKLDQEQVKWLRAEIAQRRECLDEMERKKQRSQATADKIEKETTKAISDATRQAGRNEGNKYLMDQIRARQQQNEMSAADFAVLGVNPGSSQEEITKAYRRLAMDVHPDRHPGAIGTEKEQLASRFQQVADAKSRLAKFNNSLQRGRHSWNI